MILTIDGFLELLGKLDKEEWSASVEPRGPLDGYISMRRKTSDTIFSPLTAVYFSLTKAEVHRGSFWFEEMTRDFQLPWWDIQEITYAFCKIDTAGVRYKRPLRNKILRALNLPEEKDTY